MEIINVGCEIGGNRNLNDACNAVSYTAPGKTPLQSAKIRVLNSTLSALHRQLVGMFVGGKMV